MVDEEQNDFKNGNCKLKQVFSKKIIQDIAILLGGVFSAQLIT